jgi:hypothetical protein
MGSDVQCLRSLGWRELVQSVLKEFDGAFDTGDTDAHGGLWHVVPLRQPGNGWAMSSLGATEPTCVTV